ncbi:MAG: hypothetical protein MJZ17_00865 [Bacteroidales bacterium]|nr:hypothetical protein [Bacteroidales bacterium]
MKKKGFVSFCVKAIILLALVVVVDRAVGFAFVKMKDYGLKSNPECMWLKTPYVVEKVDADVIVVGSSKATHHYIPAMIADSLGLSVYNCGQDGCFYLYQNCIINMVLDRYKPKKIIWDIQPGCLNADGGEREYQNVRYLSPYYHDDNVWAKQYIDSEDKWSSVKMQSRMFAYNSKLLNSLFPLVMGGSTTESGYIPLPSEGYDYPKLSADFEDNSEYESWPEKLELFASTIERCRKEGVQLVIIASPQYVRPTKAYQSAVEDMQKVAVRYGSEVYDYSDLFLDDPTKFKDASHLNHKGAIAFTEMVIGKHLNTHQ